MHMRIERVLSSWPLRLVAGVLAGVVARLTLDAPESKANHPIGVDQEGVHRHLLTITDPVEPEDYCVATRDPFRVSTEAMVRKMSFTLEDVLGWQAVGGGFVDFRMSEFDCAPASGPVEWESYIEVRYFASYDCGIGIGCVDEWGNPQLNPSNGHPEYRQAEVDMDPVALARECFPTPPPGQPCYTHLINHETGHVMGLADAPPCEPPSVMHNTGHGCEVDLLWPTEDDLNSVDLIISSGSRFVINGKAFLG